MFKTRKTLWLVAIMLLAMLVFAACTPGEDGGETNGNGNDTASEEVTITDMAGREVNVPTTISKVYTHAQTSTIMLYTLAPDMLLGWNYELNDLEKAYILEEYHNLTAFGMADAVNYEAIISEAPQLVLLGGSINDGIISDADDLQAQINIPVIVVNTDLDASAAAYRFLGEVLNLADRAEELAVYAETVLSWIADKTANLAEEDKVTLYYGNGEASLNTAPAGSSHAQVLDMIGAVNVAVVEAESGSRIDVSKEQIIAWNPDVVILNGEPKKDITASAEVEAFLADADYATVNAVINNQVYGSPKAPFSWIDRPAGPNRLIGLYWAFDTVYPEQSDIDIEQTIKEFYNLFYHMDLTDEQYEYLLNT